MRKWHLLLVAVVLGAAITAVWLWRRSPAPAAPRGEQSSVPPSPVSYRTYQITITGLLGAISSEEFYTAAGAQRLRSALLAMSQLPPEAQAPHLLLVLAADKVIEGKIEEARVIVEELSKQQAWLREPLLKYME